ncbi:LysR family transcriptional regulator [Tatumella saanichensis]|uniref:LysR family transcriptional regulator n=1 Tax=Tatumella saanichensis TaxID=480813 RepID=UPI0004BC0D1A|nr:LysR family transcriptional regulator [Tatumella saanichensis]
MKVTLEEMRILTAVADSGSITAAAEKLSMTVSTVSRALSRLESRLETTLMQRTTRRMALTPEGELFLQRAREILMAVEAAEDELALRRETPSGRLRINTAPSFMQHVIVPLLGEFMRRYPQIEPELATDDLPIDLLEQQADIAIRMGALADSGIHARILGYSPLRLFASPDYLRRYGMPSDSRQLGEHRTLGFTRPQVHNFWPVRDEQQQFIQINPAIRASSGETIQQLAIAGQGIARLSDFASATAVAQGLLVPVLTAETRPMLLPVHAVWYHHAGLAGRVRCFIDYLQQAVIEHGLLQPPSLAGEISEKSAADDRDMRPDSDRPADL